VFFAGNTHEEAQPVHLKVADTSTCATRCVTEYGNPCQYFCPPTCTRWSTTARAASAADQRVELCPLQGLRHQGPVRDHHLDHARRRFRPELPGHVSEGEHGRADLDPVAERVAASNLTRFADFARKHHGASGDGYGGLWRWSVEERERFWSAMMEFAGVLHTPGTAPVLRHRDRMPGAVWFEDTRLNYAENLLARDDDHVALVFCNERGTRLELTCAQLRAEVGRVAAGLRELGIGPGDRVAGFVPNLPESVIAMLAATSLGAAWTSCSPDFGINGVLDRFGQVAPRVLFTADGYFYNGKTIDSLAPVRGVLEQLPSVERVVVIPYVGEAPDVAGLPNAVSFGDFGQPGSAPQFARVPFDTPLFVMYSSGTTGVPKCIVHGVGGTLLQHRKEHLLHTDLGRTIGCSSSPPAAG